jgi:hypothetical protein
MKSALLSLLLFLSATSASAAETCKVTKALDTEAHQFMADKSMIGEGEEIHFTSIDGGIKWQLVRTVKVEEGCLLVMRLTDYPEPSDVGALEVLGFKNGSVVKYENLKGLKADDRVFIEVSVKSGGAEEPSKSGWRLARCGTRKPISRAISSWAGRDALSKERRCRLMRSRARIGSWKSGR